MKFWKLICDELLKLHGLKFYGLKTIIEEAEIPPTSLINKFSTNTLANEQQSMHKMPPTIKEAKSRLPTAPTEEQDSINNIKSTFVNVIIPKKKNIALFSDSIPRGMKMKQQIFQTNEKRINLKTFPGAQAN